VFELEGELEQMRRRMDRLERRAEQLRKEFEDEVARVRRSVRFDLVRYEPPERALTRRPRG
jgi:predicted  nucleic acid-binding Zn-ribbon protein